MQGFPHGGVSISANLMRAPRRANGFRPGGGAVGHECWLLDQNFYLLPLFTNVSLAEAERIQAGTSLRAIRCASGRLTMSLLRPFVASASLRKLKRGKPAAIRSASSCQPTSLNCSKPNVLLINPKALSATAPVAVLTTARGQAPPAS